MVKVCTGTRTMHTLGESVYRCNEEVFFDDTSLEPDFPGGREQD